MNGVKNGASIFLFLCFFSYTGTVTNGLTFRASVSPDTESLMLSIMDLTRSFMEPTLLMSSSLSRVRALPCLISSSLISSSMKASGPHPNEVNSMYWTSLPCMAAHLADFRILLT